MRTLFGLIACTGLRISEALALVDADVDLKAGVLTVRCSKFGKSRLVPLHPSAVIAPCAPTAVSGRSMCLHDPEDAVLHRHPRPPSRPGRSVIGRCIASSINCASNSAGSLAAATVRPRIHDLRHSFAVRRLICAGMSRAWTSHQHMLALSTYMGHAKVSNTYWYLTGVPELLPWPGRRFEHFVDVQKPGRTTMVTPIRPGTQLRGPGAGVLRRAPAAAARDEPAHRGRLPRCLRAVPGLRAGAAAQAAHVDPARPRSRRR
jgi:hypothetical protein